MLALWLSTVWLLPLSRRTESLLTVLLLALWLSTESLLVHLSLTVHTEGDFRPFNQQRALRHEQPHRTRDNRKMQQQCQPEACSITKINGAAQGFQLFNVIRRTIGVHRRKHQQK